VDSSIRRKFIVSAPFEKAGMIWTTKVSFGSAIHLGDEVEYGKIGHAAMRARTQPHNREQIGM